MRRCRPSRKTTYLIGEAVAEGRRPSVFAVDLGFEHLEANLAEIRRALGE